MSNVPKLRFKEFSGEWKSKKIKELTNYVDYRGKTPTKTETGVFLVTAKNIKQGFIDYASSQEYISTDDYEEVMRRGKPLKGDVLLTTEAPLGNIAQIDREDIALAQRVIKFRGNELLDNGFLKHYMLGNKFQRLLEIKAIGTTVLGIQGKVLHSLPLTIPIKQEQEKIASFLTSVDSKIEQLTKKEELLSSYKKGVMQKIFSGEIKFKADDGSEFCEWEETTVETHFDVGSSKRVLQQDWTNEGIPFYRTRELVSLSKNEPFSSEIFISQELFSELVNKYGIPKDGDFLVSGVGTLGVYYQVKPTDKFYFKDGNVLWFKRKPTIISDFFKYCFESDYVQNQIVTQASTTTVGTYTIQNAKKTKLFVPTNLMEQTKIANFLSSIDAKIEQVQKQLNSTKEFKKALLQQMFV